MKKGTIETSVGVFVLIGLICVGYLTIKLGKMELLSSQQYYPVFARFQDASGLKKGVQVEMAGVEIGKVEDISLDTERELATVKMLIRKDIVLTDDTIAAIKTSGLIGDRYVKIIPGGSPMTIEPGGFITETESAVDIEALVSKYVFGSADDTRGENQ